MDKDIIPLTATTTLERIRHVRQNKMIQKVLDKDTSIMVEDPLENEMVLNMGPQHPATHGVLRVLLRRRPATCTTPSQVEETRPLAR
jgi:hypothetical protein